LGALCSWERAQASLGLIPAAAAEITKQAKVDNMDFEKLRQQTERIGSLDLDRIPSTLTMIRSPKLIV
jgi:adenylosuccinate lyase